MFDNLNNDNFLMYAAKCYDSPNCIMSEMENDLKRTKYIKRLLRKYKTTGELKERLILNHIILIYNVFGPEATCRILFFKVDPKDYDILKSFLQYLNLMPKIVMGINGSNIESDLIPIDLTVYRILSQL